MKKIGIMTWYHYHNYGSALQCTALSHVIRKLGYEPYLIQYHPRKTTCTIPTYRIKDIYHKVKKKVYINTYVPYTSKRREELFIEFLKSNISETEVVDTFPELYQLNDKLDAFVCGSDQIWAPSCFDDKYFLSYVQNTSKMVAYAPSLGVNKIDDIIIKEKMKCLISRFKHISVRETQGAKIIRDLCNIEANVVLDPTLLIEANDWDKIIGTSKIKEVNQQYILCYFLGDERKYMDTVKKIASLANLQIVIIPTTTGQKTMVECIKDDIGPSEFLYLIKHASYVCTDSFHGVAFSINYKKPFTTFKRFKDTDKICQNSRIYSLLNLLGLKDRLDGEKEIEHSLLKYDYNQVESKLIELRKESLCYLDDSLKDATDTRVKTEEAPYYITKQCCGCGACMAVCPTNAVSVSLNESGFYQYTIDDSKCIKCGKCKKVCPNNLIEAEELKEMVGLFSYRTDNRNVLKKSSSGGAGYEIASLLNKEHYWICGVTYDNKIDNAKHILIKPDKENELVKIQGSKYIQSNSAPAINKLANLPINEKAVFFGTPCQVAGLDKVLKSQGRRKDFILVDLICHGVPSQNMFNKYLFEIKEKYKLEDHPIVNFRSGKNGWRNMMISISDSKTEYNKSEKKDMFYSFFRYGLCYLESCYDCPYRQKSAADIRIGDYWGNKFESETIGVSMLLANTEKGYEILKKIPGNLKEQNKEDYWTIQYPYNPPKPIFYDPLINELKREDILLSDLRKKYARAFEKREKIGNLKSILKKIGRNK